MYMTAGSFQTEDSSVCIDCMGTNAYENNFEYTGIGERAGVRFLNLTPGRSATLSTYLIYSKSYGKPEPLREDVDGPRGSVCDGEIIGALD